MAHPEQANWVQRTMQRFAALRPVASVFRHTFHHLDKALYRVLGHRTLSGIIAGVPNIMLTTTGAKSGHPRTVPLVGPPVDGGVAVIATRWGSATNPGWAYNLDHDPHASMERDGTHASDVLEIMRLDECAQEQSQHSGACIHAAEHELR